MALRIHNPFIIAEIIETHGVAWLSRKCAGTMGVF